MADEWTVEDMGLIGANLLTPSGIRVARMTRARAYGIAAALNTPEGRAAFEEARLAFSQPQGQG